MIPEKVTDMPEEFDIAAAKADRRVPTEQPLDRYLKGHFALNIVITRQSSTLSSTDN